MHSLRMPRIWEGFVLTTFVALYRGQTIGKARLVAVSADSELVQQVTNLLLRDTGSTGDGHADGAADAVLGTLEQARKAALRIIRDGGA